MLTRLLFIFTILFANNSIGQNWQDYFHPPQDLPLEKPALLDTFDMLGNKAFRVSDYDTISMLFDNNQSNGYYNLLSAHTYPRQHAFSKDNNYITSNSSWKWKAFWHSDGTFWKAIDKAGSGRARWSNINDNLMYVIDRNLTKLYELNVITEDTTLIRTFPDTIAFGNSEGDISFDGKKVVFNVKTYPDTNNTTLYFYDIENDTYTEHVIPRKYTKLNWASVSPSGNYVLLAYDDNGDLLLYDWNGNYIRRIAKHEHGDIGFDENGDECWFGIGGQNDSIPGYDFDYYSIYKYRLSDNQATILLGADSSFSNDSYSQNESLSGHISARTTDVRPGVIYVSLNDPEGPFHFFTLKTDGSEEIEFWGWDNSTSEGNSPQLTPDRFGRSGVWKSDWGTTRIVTDTSSSNGNVTYTKVKEMYLVHTCFETRNVDSVESSGAYTWGISGDTYSDPGIYTYSYQDSGCFVTDSLILLTNTLSTNDIEKGNFLIFPNPTNDILMIQLKNTSIKNYNIEVINNLGQVVIKESNTESLSLGKIQSGIYSIRIFNKFFDFRKRLIKN